MNCRICDKSFSGLVCYQQHEASEKHKRKMKLYHVEVSSDTFHDTSMSNSADAELELIHCSTCSISVKGLLNFQKHANSLQHADMVKKKTEGNPVENYKIEYHSEEPVNADVDQLMNPGPIESFGYSASLIPNTFAHCDLCQKQFTGPEPYQQHIYSAGHKKKSALQEQNKNRLMPDNVDGEQQIQSRQMEGVQSINSGCGISHAYAKCEFCNMIFTGPEPHQLHLDSAAHQKKAAMQLDSNIVTAEGQNGNLNLLICKICDKAFSGPVPYNQHMDSIVHKKKVLNLEQLRKFTNLDESLLPDSTTLNLTFNTELNLSNQKWYCEVCKKQCSGPIPYNQHIISEVHRKHERAAKVEENLRKINASDQVGDNEMHELSKDSEINNLNFGKCINDDKTNEFCKDFRIKNDLIFCDALKNIEIIPPGDMNISVFYPDQEIVFEGPSKKNNKEIFFDDFNLDESP